MSQLFNYWIIVSIKFGPNVILRICSEATSDFAKLFKLITVFRF